MKNIIIKFNETGSCEIDVDRAIKKWNHLWRISQWHEKYTLVKYVRKDSPITQFKVTILEFQAMQLIKELGLIQYKSDIFRNGSTWK